MTPAEGAGAIGQSGAAAGAPPDAAWRWSLDGGQCVGCGVCADVCRSEAIVMTRAMALPEPVPGACIGCHDCVHECPTEAISIRSPTQWS